MPDYSKLKEVIKTLGLKHHPIEGGYFRETFRSNEKTLRGALPQRFDGDRSFMTQIYYVISPNRISSLHKMLADETWHFYLGSPINLVEITPDGKVIETKMGTDLSAGQVPQYTVANGNWLGAWNLEPDQFSLVGCSVAPGMELDDYEHGLRADLLKMFPHLEDLIMKLTWDTDKPPPPVIPDDGD